MKFNVFKNLTSICGESNVKFCLYGNDDYCHLNCNSIKNASVTRIAIFNEAVKGSLNQKLICDIEL